MNSASSSLPTSSVDSSPAPLSEICIVACAEAFRGDSDILCNPIGTIPIIGGRLARATFAPDMALTDTVSVLVGGVYPVGNPSAEKMVESYAPYRTVFDIVWSGRRHVLMGASQIDMWGNQNIAAIGGWEKPKAQLLGLRGAPGNLVNHVTSYWVYPHTTRSFVEKVDVVSGPGYDRMREVGAPMSRFHQVRRVVSNLGVFDFDTPDRRMRIRSLHPGVTLEEIRDNTGFDLVVGGYGLASGDLASGDLASAPPESRLPTEDESKLIQTLDPTELRLRELPD